MLLTTMCLGLRCSELIGLKWSDFGKGVVRVQRAVVENRVDAVKTRYSEDDMPLDGEVARFLLAWKEKAPTGSEWVFASPADGTRPYRPDTVLRYRIQPVALRLGLGRLGWHDLRHTYRPWLDETGAPLKVQQELMRHADIRTAMNIYGAAMSESKRQANSKIVTLALRRETAVSATAN